MSTIQESKFSEDVTSTSENFRLYDPEFQLDFIEFTQAYRKILVENFIFDYSLKNSSKLKVKPIPAPILKGHPAKQNTVKNFRGRLSEIIPSLSNVSEEDIEESLLRSRRKN